MVGTPYAAEHGARNGPIWKELPVYAQFVKAVISIMISSAIVEALFNKYSARHEKSLSLSDEGWDYCCS